jgi:hypothetical protein
MYPGGATELIELPRDDERPGAHNLHRVAGLSPFLIPLAQLRPNRAYRDIDSLLNSSREFPGRRPASAAVLARQEVGAVVLDLSEHERANAAAGLKERINALAWSGDRRASDELLETSRIP